MFFRCWIFGQLGVAPVLPEQRAELLQRRDHTPSDVVVDVVAVKVFRAVGLQHAVQPRGV